MGPSDPWSPAWRPDPTGGRQVAIRAMRRGALLAGVLHVATSVVVVVASPFPDALDVLVLAVGLPAVALLGAGLAPSTLGTRVDAVVAGVAFALGAPVATVTSAVVGGFVVDSVATGVPDLAGPILRAGMSIAVSLAPVVAAAAALFVIGVRRLARGDTAVPPTLPPGI